MQHACIDVRFLSAMVAAARPLTRSLRRLRALLLSLCRACPGNCTIVRDVTLRFFNVLGLSEPTDGGWSARIVQLSVPDQIILGRSDAVTRKLCYRKDDHAMHIIYECPESFLDSLTMPMDIFPKLF